MNLCVTLGHLSGYSHVSYSLGPGLLASHYPFTVLPVPDARGQRLRACGRGWLAEVCMSVQPWAGTRHASRGPLPGMTLSLVAVLCVGTGVGGGDREAPRKAFLRVPSNSVARLWQATA